MAERVDLPIVLAVDGEQQNLEFLQRALRQEYQLHLTTSPEEAVQMLRTHRIDVVVADYIMPKLSGVDVLERAAEYAPHAARVLISGFADAKALADAINRAAVRHFIAKPFSVQQVREILRAAVPQNRPQTPQGVIASADVDTRARSWRRCSSRAAIWCGAPMRPARAPRSSIPRPTRCSWTSRSAPRAQPSF